MKHPAYWQALRIKRNVLLQETDKFMLPDFPIDTKTRGLYREYRQYLRDCPKLFDDENIKQAQIKEFSKWLEWKKSGNY